MSRIAPLPKGTPIPKPEPKGKKPPKYIKAKIDTKWLKTRKEFLAGKANHAGLYKCELCGAYTEAPEVDHVQTRGSRADLKYDLTNLRLLDRRCHARRHSQAS